MISSMKVPRRRNAQFDLTYLLEPLRQSQANNTSSNDEDGLGISHIALNNLMVTATTKSANMTNP